MHFVRMVEVFLVAVLYDKGPSPPSSVEKTRQASEPHALRADRLIKMVCTALCVFYCPVCWVAFFSAAGGFLPLLLIHFSPDTQTHTRNRTAAESVEHQDKLVGCHTRMSFSSCTPRKAPSPVGGTRQSFNTPQATAALSETRASHCGRVSGTVVSYHSRGSIDSRVD